MITGFRVPRIYFLLDNTDGNGEFTADDVTVVNRNGLKDNMKYSAIKYYDTDVLRCARAVVANIGEGRRQNKFAVFEKYLSDRLTMQACRKNA